MVDFEQADSDPQVSLTGEEKRIAEEIEIERDQAVATEISAAIVAMAPVTMAGAAIAMSGVGSGFQFSPEQIATQLKHCQQLKEDLRADQVCIMQIEEVDPPAPDKAGSALQAKSFHKLGVDLMKRNHSQIEFLEQWARRLADAKRDYMQQEHVTEHQWNRLARGLPR
ncbi:MAG: PE domain-containing protein [Sciscionella sp.]